MALSGAGSIPFRGHSGPVYSVAFGPDGTTLASGGDDATVRLWDVSTGEGRGGLTGHAGTVRSVAFSPDGATLASGGDDGTVRLWDVRTGAERSQLTGHAGLVWSVAFSPDGATLASGGNDGTVRLWDASTGQQRAQLTGHAGLVWSVAFSPDGATLASGGADETIRLWDARLGTSGVHGRPLAGVRSDSPSADDLLGIRGDVETLADLIAATDTRPPLAIALIGDWGIGKSSVMLQVQHRIRLLARMSLDNPGLSAFAANVRQVRFNAWHYSDDHLWAGLVRHLFQTLAIPDDQGATAKRKETPHADQPQDGRADLASIQKEQAELRRKVAAAQEKSMRLAKELDAVDQIARSPGALAGVRSPLYIAWLVKIAARVTIRSAATTVSVLFTWAVLVATAFLAWYFFGSKSGAIVSAVAALTAPAVLVHRAVRRLTDNLRGTLGDAQVTARQEADKLKERQLLIDAAARLGAFHEEHGAPSAYREHRGLLGQVHEDLVQLSENLAHARAEWVASGSVTPPPLERIVLYIDDLDRCPPQRVVEVLEAVHLMLALDLFVVVVAVDARWLIRSLNYHHQELFRPANGNADLADEDPAGPATPIDYLDKIFQVPYTLMPPTAAATATYLHAILSGPASAPGPVAGSPVPAAGGRRDGNGEPPGSVAREMTAPEGAPGTGNDANPGSRDDGGKAGSGGGGMAGSGGGGMADSGGGGTAAQERGSAMTETELRPQSLQLTLAEVDFMARLGGLVPTPRAAKRMANLYRLVRISIPDAELAAFTGGGQVAPYQVVQILLAILAGSPTVADQIFRRILKAPGEDDLLTIFTATDLGDTVTDSFGRIRNELQIIGTQTTSPVKVADCQLWCPVLARYSFHTRSLVGLSGEARSQSE